MNRSIFFSLCLLLSLSLSSQGQNKPQWARYPSISPDGSQVVFTYKGDLYKVASDGGRAIQLTFHEGHEYYPTWSPDGQSIAFASDRYGNFDVYVMSAEGGEATRLTYHSNDEHPFSFSHDGKEVIFGGVRQDLASHRQYPTGSQPELYAVPIEGGRVNQVFTIPAEAVQVSKDGQRMIYHDKKGGENEWRKYHQSAIARDLWVYDAANDMHQQISTFYGEDRNPVFAPDEQSIYYLSEQEGTFNVFKMSLNAPGEGQALTSFDTHPVRFLSISNTGLMCFSYDGELYTLKEGEEPQKIAIDIRTSVKSNPDAFITINGGVSEMALSPDGKEIAFIARGEVFVTAVDGSITKRITKTPEQERFVGFSEDGSFVYYASEREGKWSIYKSSKVREAEPFFYASTLLKEEPIISNSSDNYQPKFSPDGKKLAFVEDRRSLKVMDIASKEVVTLLTPDQLFHMRDGDQYFEWSPDSKWILASYNPTMANGEVVLVAADGKSAMHNLSKSGYDENRPFWGNENQIVWYSNRDGLKSFATSGGSQSDIYTLFLNKEAWDKYNLSKDDYALLQEMEKKNGKDGEEKKEESKKEEVKTVKIEWEDLDKRKARLTPFSSSLSGSALSADGEKLYYLVRFDRGYNLWSTELRTRETKQEIALNGSGGSLTWDKEKKNLFMLSGGSISKINPSTGKRDNISIRGEMSFDADAERAYLFEHVWIRTKGIFYTPDMHGADWTLLKTEYEKYLPHIGNEYEYAEMLSELLGELNVSHAGARYSRSIENGDQTASLGIFMDYNHEGNGIRIEEIIKGGPLDKADLNVKAGMVIESINGVAITPDTDIAKHLNRLAGSFTLLDVLDPSSNSRQQVTVKPITVGAENSLLYQRWVKKNQEEVEERSGGRLGYVHIPGMSDGPYRNTYEEMMGKYHDKEGIVVDTRFNGGGDLVADLAMFFTGEKFLTYATEDRDVGYEPTFRWTKPTLAMFNEGNYSDGHCFACGYTDLNIGKTVGMPTPGTCSFAGWEGLSNGVRWGAVPISAKNKAGEWLENNETKPQFQVKNMPGIVDKGRDQQLEKAIEELLKDVN